MSLLYFRISRDYDFLIKIASEITKNDYAVEKMLEIVQTIHEEAKLGKINQPISLVLQRSVKINLLFIIFLFFIGLHVPYEPESAGQGGPIPAQTGQNKANIIPKIINRYLFIFKIRINSFKKCISCMIKVGKKTKFF